MYELVRMLYKVCPQPLSCWPMLRLSSCARRPIRSNDGATLCTSVTKSAQRMTMIVYDIQSSSDISLQEEWKNGQHESPFSTTFSLFHPVSLFPIKRNENVQGGYDIWTGVDIHSAHKTKLAYFHIQYMNQKEKCSTGFDYER